MAKDDPIYPRRVKDDSTRNDALADDLRLTFLGHGPATHRSARIVATSKDDLNVPHKVEMNAIKPSDPGPTRCASVPSASVVPDADDWPEASIVPEDGVGTQNYVSLIKDPPVGAEGIFCKCLWPSGLES